MFRFQLFNCCGMLRVLLVNDPNFGMLMIKSWKNVLWFCFGIQFSLLYICFFVCHCSSKSFDYKFCESSDANFLLFLLCLAFLFTVNYFGVLLTCFYGLEEIKESQDRLRKHSAGNERKYESIGVSVIVLRIQKQQ